MSSARRTSVAALIAWLTSAALAGAAGFIDPRLTFNRVTTPHFTIYFEPSTAVHAQHLAAIAEDVWQAAASRLGLAAPPHTDVILVDQADIANGSATPVPYNTIVVTAAAPSALDQVGRTDDWLRLVFAHEFTHILHLDQSRGWARGIRRIFGRTPLAFPNLFLPTWQIEGLAAYEESALTGQGRLHAGDFRAIEREAARTSRFPALDRVNGGVTDWPGGAAPYAFGLGLHEYLAQQYGEAQFGTLARATAGRFPYTQSRSFQRVYGKSLGELWEEYAHDTTGHLQAVAAPTPTRLTEQGFVVAGPRFIGESRILYSVRNADRFPSLQAIDITGSTASRSGEEIATRYLGSTAAVHGSTIIFDQQEIRRSTGLYSDLFALDVRSGRVRALTRESRLQDPDFSPDGTMLTAVREHDGQRDLVLVHFPAVIDAAGDFMIDEAAILTLAGEAHTQHNAPRFSPDGTRIAVQRRRPGVLSELVTIDVRDRSTQIVASDPAARIVTPTWRPDGGAIVAAADYGEQPFQLFEYAATTADVPPRQLTNLPGGATWPAVSADGRTIVFVGYTSDGFDLFRIGYPGRAAVDSRDLAPPPSVVAPANPASATGREGTPRDRDRVTIEPEPVDSSIRRYSPLRTLRPTSWFPVIEHIDGVWRAGAGTSGVDVLGRHAYTASVTWLLEQPGAPGSVDRGTPDWTADYAYTRWWPTVFISSSEQTRFAQGPPDAFGRPTAATLRELQVETGIVQPITHVRDRHQAFASFRTTADRYARADGQEQVRLSAARLAWSSRTAHVFDYSISPERGVAVGGTAELTRTALGSDADANTWTADLRAYLPAFAVHDVVALRVAGGRSSGEPGATRYFHMGGSIPAGDVIDFGQDAFSLMRGFAADAFAGTRAALVNAEYRVPLARPQRGSGTFPILLHTLHAAAFGDLGHVWTRRADIADVKLSIGGELSADVVAGYGLPLTVALGGAWARDGARAQRDRSRGAALYLRVGRAF